MKKRKKHHRKLLHGLTFVSITALAAIIAASLLVYFYPSLQEDGVHALRAVSQSCGKWADSSRQVVADWWNSFRNPPSEEKPQLGEADGAGSGSGHSAPGSGTQPEPGGASGSSEPAGSDSPAGSDGEPIHRTFTPSSELGDVVDLDSFDVPDDISSYYIMLDTAMGSMMYYNQGDARWADFLCGGRDPMKRFGCGPTAIAMLVSSFSETGGGLSPVELAQWADENGFYAAGDGSYHTLVKNALDSYGLQVETVANRTVEYTSELLESGHVLVALMKRGTLTNSSGHFVLITKRLENGNVWIADPASYKNCMKEWALDGLLSELKVGAGGGGPLWAVSVKE